MFEIGNSLREARLRQGLDLAGVEADTKIRAKYLQALEAERFDVLPGETYVKGFLRAYAEYLGLDGQLYVDEFNSRFASGEDVLPASVPVRRPRSRVSESNFVVVALAGIVAVTILVVVAFAFGNGGRSEPQVTPAATGKAKTSAKTPRTQRSRAAGERKRSRPRIARLALTAARGDCWIEVRKRSATGELVFSGTMYTGQVERFSGKRLWVHFGAADNVDARLNGHRVSSLPSGQAIVLVTPRGIRPQASA